MAEQKKQTNEALNVEDALTQSEAFLIKNKKHNYWCYFSYNHHYSRYSNVQEPLCSTS